MNNDRAADGRGGGRGYGAGRGTHRGGRGGRGGGSYRAGGPKWTSKNPDLKYDILLSGTAENAAKYTESMKEVIEWIKKSGQKEAETIASAIEAEVTPIIPPPPAPVGEEDPANPGQRLAVDPAETTIYQEEIKMVAKRRGNLRDGMQWAYALLKGQCPPTTWGKIVGEEGFEQVDAAKNPIELKRRIKRVCCGFEAHKQRTYAVAQAIVLLATTIQEYNESPEDFYRNFDAKWSMIEQFGGSLAKHPGLIRDKAIALALADGRGEDDVEDADVEMAEEMVADEMKACLMLCTSNRKRFGPLRDDLANSHVKGDDCYPRTCGALMGMMRNFRAPTAYNQIDRLRIKDEDGMQFLQGDGIEDKEGETSEDGAAMVQKGGSKDGRQGRVNSKGENHCFSCGSTGHWANECPKKRDGELLIQQGAMISQIKSDLKTGGLRKNYLYLDTCSTINQVVNQAYLTGVHTSEEPLRLHTNAGTSMSEKQGYLGSTLFWLDSMGIANVVSLRSLEARHRVSYDSTKEGGAFVVHTKNGDVVFDRCAETGFPYIDLDDVSFGDNGAMLVQTVRGNYEGFTERDVLRARAARELQHRMGQPSDTEIKHLLKEKEKVSHALLKNCPLTIDDWENAKVIFGPSVPRLKGTSRRMKPTRAEPEYIRIPRDLVDMNKYVTLVADVMFVCGLPFLISLSRRIRFVTLQYMPNRSAGEIKNGLKDVVNLYLRAGFVIQAAIMDNEFEKIKTKLLPVCEVNTTAKNEHVGEIEQKIQHVKGRSRSVKATLPYKRLPNAVIKGMLSNVVMWMNAVFDKQGISKKYFPREIVLRRGLDYATHAKGRFGSYCEAYDDPTITNNQEERCKSCIYLGSTGNFQGTCRFLNLDTGCVIKRRFFTEIPMPTSVIRRVEYWADRDKQDARASLAFRNRNNERFSWDDNDDDTPIVEDNAVEPAVPVAPFPHITDELPGIPLESETPVPALRDEEPTTEDRARRAAANADIGPDIIPGDAGDDRSGIPGVPHQQINNNFIYNNNALNNNANIAMDDDGDEVPALMRPAEDSDDEDEDYVPSDQEDEELVMEDVGDEEEEPVTTRSGRRVIPNQRYQHFQMLQARGKFDDADLIERAISKAEEEDGKIGEIDGEPIKLEPGEARIFACIMAQVSLKAGLKKWGKAAEESVMKEMRQMQMHDLEAFFPRDPKTMTREQRVRALSSLIFLKEKDSGEIKSGTCINGVPQRAYIKKEDAASPTASTDSVFMVGAINAYEERDTVTADLPGAFLNTVTDKLVFMVLKGELCELMVRVNPKIYRRYVTKDSKGKPIMYVQLYKSVYGLLRSALLFYRKLRKELEDFGFKINPYDPCVANRISENGEQQTVVWHVDDLHASHKDPKENTKLIEYLQGIYGDKMTVNRGKKHRYLGMDFDYTKAGVLSISMVKYIEDMIDEFPELITKTSRTPHTDNLFRVRDESEATFLSEDQAQQFHRVVAQLLFLSCRARRDIQTSVSFLTSRVKKPDANDWGKLKRVLQYLKGTKSMPLNLEVDNLQCTRWLIDASHGVHDDCKGHTGAAMTLGKGAAISGSWKHKGNSKSSTESEIIGVDDAIGTVLWSLYFLQEQGYETSHAVIYQDNKSAILLETNGKFSSSKRTKHIKMKFFFVKDKVDDGEIKSEYLPTEEMWIDMHSKPSQGIRFERDRSKRQNVPVHWPDETISPMSNSSPMTKATPQECLGITAF